MTKETVQALCDSLTLNCLGIDFQIIVAYDKVYTRSMLGFEPYGRLYVQLSYCAPCTKTGEHNIWKGAKHYLSSHMTEDEIVKTVFKAFKQAVEHEVMEGFKFEGQIVFNPHTSFRDLLEVSNKEVTREEHEEMG